MPQPLDEFLQDVERRAGAAGDMEARYLWPRTPRSGDLQDKIHQRMGVTDREIGDPRSRPAMILSEIRRLQSRGRLNSAPSILDIACGDALVLLALKRALPGASCYGVDCAKGAYSTHADAEEGGVRLFNGLIQDLFISVPPAPFDVALMLNTFRGWESADLHADEADLPRRAEQWLLSRARYAIVTATNRQVLELKRQGIEIKRLGKGEDESMMIS